MKVSGTKSFANAKKQPSFPNHKYSRHSESDEALTSRLHIPQYIGFLCTPWRQPLASSPWDPRVSVRRVSPGQPRRAGPKQSPAPSACRPSRHCARSVARGWAEQCACVAGYAGAGVRWPLAVERGIQGDGGDAAAGASSGLGLPPSCRG